MLNTCENHAACWGCSNNVDLLHVSAIIMYWHVKVKSSGLLRESDAGQISKSIEMEGGLSSSPNMGEM
jgi:hypothetical protein